MARPLRIEFEGALYHVTSRGNAGQEIFVDEEDRHAFLEILGDTVPGVRSCLLMSIPLNFSHGPTIAN